MWKLVKRHVPEKKIVKVEGAILVEDDEDDEETKILEFSKVSEHCHKTNARETGISGRIESTISTCFITMLHLANDKNLAFQKTDEDFRIYKHKTEGPKKEEAGGEKKEEAGEAPVS